MNHLPLGIDLRGRACTVVGGGAVGTRKVRTLAAAGAVVTVVSPELCEELAAEIAAGRAAWVQESFRPEHVHGAFLVVMASDDRHTNAAGARAAAEAGVLSCDASSAATSQVHFGALTEQGGVTVAVFTDGRSPGRAARTRDEIAGLLAGGPHAEAASVDTGDTLLVLVAHGSRNLRWSDHLEDLTASIRAEVGCENVRLAYAQFASPTLEDVVAEAVHAGVRKVRVLPLFMTEAGHVDRDLRPMVSEILGAYGGVEVDLLPPIGHHAAFRQVLVQIAEEAAR